MLSIVNENTVEVKWDPAPDIEGYEESPVEQQVYSQASGIRIRKMDHGEWMLKMRLMMKVTRKMK